jgi:TatA/E family protein of Tat protein translocase
MDYFGLIGGIGTTELLLILGVIVVLFGAKLLPKLSRGVGESVNELRSSLKPQKAAAAVADDRTDQDRSASAVRLPRS